MVPSILVLPLLVWPLLIAFSPPIESADHEERARSYTVFPSILGPSGGMLCGEPEHDLLFTLGTPAGGASANEGYLLWAGFKPPAPRVWPPLCPTWEMVPLPDSGDPCTLGFRELVPSPTTGLLRITFGVASSAGATVTIHDPAGRIIRHLAHTTAAPGLQETRWDACDDTGRPEATGVYFLHLMDGSATDVRKVVLLR